MPLQIVAARIGGRGRQYTTDAIRLMEAMVDEVARRTTAITARFLYYRMESKGFYAKTEANYIMVTKYPLALRRSGDIDWASIADGTRIKTRWVGWGDLADAADEWRRTYRRDIWRTASAMCEVWSESRGLLTTINEIASGFGVTTFGMGGFPAATIGWQTAQDVRKAIARPGVPRIPLR
ncbi:MAG: hypothetical protein LH650_04585 [Chloroflexi bacterium]|nr:hypothetical protein [Chloroflexota bacterium]